MRMLGLFCAGLLAIALVLHGMAALGDAADRRV
jgi:hypothetical protein